MRSKEFSKIRHHLGSTQLQIAQLLGTSVKAIRSFEQGWRNIPVHAERQVLFLLASKKYTWLISLVEEFRKEVSMDTSR